MENSRCMKCGCITYEGRHICLTCEGTDDMQTFKRQKMPPKTNRDKLSQVDMYDLLCRMNEKSVRGFLCVLQMLDEKQRVRTRCDDFGVDGTHYDGCRKCIAAWLYEPKEGRW